MREREGALAGRDKEAQREEGGGRGGRKREKERELAIATEADVKTNREKKAAST